MENCKWSLDIVAMVYKWLKRSFVSLAWPWSGRSLPLGQPVGVLGPCTGTQCGQAPSSSPPTWSLTGWHFVTWLVGCPIAASWLTSYFTKCQLTLTPRSDQTSTWPNLGGYVWSKVSLTQKLTRCQPDPKHHLGICLPSCQPDQNLTKCQPDPKPHVGGTSDQRAAWPKVWPNVNLTKSLNRG